MKKSMLMCCSALFALAVFADEPAPAPEAGMPKAPQGERGPRGMRGPRQAPVMIQITDKTTAEEVEAFKKNVMEKIDKSYAEYKAKPAPEGAEKPALHVGVMIVERRPGMGPGMRGPGQGQGMGPGMRGPRGDRGPRRGGAGDKPAPAPEAK